MSEASLTARQKHFVQEYLVDKNASRAYRAAGYPGKGAEQSASRLLRNVKVAKAVEMGLAKLADKLEISAERTLRRLAEIAYHSKKAKTSDVLRACELIGKHLGMFRDKVEMTAKGRDLAPMVILTMPRDGSEASMPAQTSKK